MKPRSARDRLLHRRLRAFERALPEALDGNPVSVHKARVASRRLREAVPVVLVDAAARKVRRLARGFRRVTRALGPVRELDVTAGVLDEVALAHPQQASSLQVVTRELQVERERRRQEMLGAVEHARTDRLIALLRDVADADDLQPVAVRQSVSRAVLAVRIVRRVRGLQQAVEAAGPLYAPAPLHRVRIATKKLRYALELAQELRLAPARRPLRLLEQMQETLGRLHDLQVLIERLASAQALLAGSDLSAAADLARVASDLDDECRRLHAEYVAAREPLLEAVAQALDRLTAVPARNVETEPVSHSIH
jgi:CHAD domain-containing protein